jgi:hypothetical protein
MPPAVRRVRLSYRQLCPGHHCIDSTYKPVRQAQNNPYIPATSLCHAQYHFLRVQRISQAICTYVFYFRVRDDSSSRPTATTDNCFSLSVAWKKVDMNSLKFTPGKAAMREPTSSHRHRHQQRPLQAAAAGMATSRLTDNSHVFDQQDLGPPSGLSSPSWYPAVGSTVTLSPTTVGTTLPSSAPSTQIIGEIRSPAVELR